MSTTRSITIISTCPDPWGGSEELWAMSVPLLQEAGYQISLVKEHLHIDHPRIKELQQHGVQFHQLHSSLRDRRLQLIHEGLYKISKPGLKPVHARFDRYLNKENPELVLIAQGSNFDGLRYAWLCLQKKIPYVIISQKAVDFHWPQSHQRKFMEEAFQGAETCIFVCKENLTLTEEQFGFRFKNERIISNPLRIEPELIPYPDTSRGFSLACIARLFVTDKGQDMLFRVLASSKWKKRNLKVSLFGRGKDEDGLRKMAQLLDLSRISFRGFSMNVKAALNDHHALILPSRNEGLPLTILEAMACGRTVIATNAGGSSSLIQDGVTGFLGFASQCGIDHVLEKAWSQRGKWEEMGKTAFRQMINRENKKPARTLAHILIEHLNV